MHRRTSRLRNGWIRTAVRCAVLLVATAILLSERSSPQVLVAVPGASPFVAITTSLATRSLGPAAILASVILVLALVRRRWFCRWACPVGLMNECAGRISPVSTACSGRVPRLGVWLVVLSLSAAVVGYPLLIWLDPLAIFSGALGLVGDSGSAAARAAAALLGGIVVLSSVLPGVWCGKLCPLGATQDLLAQPRLQLRRGNASNSDSPADEELIRRPMNRRHLLTTAVGAICALAGVRIGLTAQARGEEGEPVALRPPGAAPQWQFGQVCVRCGNCVRTCPSAIVSTSWHSASWSAWLTPEVSFDSDYCREDCVRCIEACPSGALASPTGGVENKPAMGLAHIVMDRCLLALGRECQTMCREVCPYDAIRLHEWTWEDDRCYPIVDADGCPGCGACQVACTPMDAIVVSRPLEK